MNVWTVVCCQNVRGCVDIIAEIMMIMMKTMNSFIIVLHTECLCSECTLALHVGRELYI